MEGIKTYLVAVVCAAMAVSVAGALQKEGAVRKAVLLVGGVFLTIVVLTPLVKADLTAFSQYLSKIQLEQDERTTGIKIGNEELMAQIIQEKTEAYILEKAESLGAEVEVQVTVQTDAEYPYPNSVTVTGPLAAGQKDALSQYMAESLAIPEERQVFLP